MRNLHSFIITIVFLFWYTNVHAAEIQKFVYVFNDQAQILQPSNAAAQCPDPNSNSAAPASVCQGVLVSNNGNYEVEFAENAAGTLLFVVNQYRYIAAGSGGVSSDTYVLLNSKRRVDTITQNETNTGVDINTVSEAAVEAVEKKNNVPKGKQGTVNGELASVLDQIDADALNNAMGNGNSDNVPDSTSKQKERDIINAQQDNIDTNTQAVLVELAEVALNNPTDTNQQEYIRKSILQGLVEPARLAEVSDRVFSHIARSQSSESDQTIMVLESDRYLLFTDEIASLTTANSFNASGFFAYTWQGVNSDTSNATFTRTSTGSYLVCATGEINIANDSSTDCIRIAVKNVVEAIARANIHRVGTANSVSLSGALSIGAESFAWSGAGTFSNASAAEPIWTAPDTPGTYEITLTVNGEYTDSLQMDVYDVAPVAIAAANPYVVYLENGQALSSLLSGSVSTDGSAIESLLWSVAEQPDGAQATIQNNSAATATLIATQAGYYTIQLTASKRNLTSTTEISVHVRQSQAPVADAGDDQIGYRNESVSLNGSRSYAPRGKTLSYAWSSTQGSISNANSSTAQFTMNSIGEYSATLLVDDGNQNASDSVNISIRNRLPAASDDVYANFLNEILLGQLIAVDGDGDTLSYSVVTDPQSGGVTVDSETGEFTYLPGGIKGCQYKPYAKPSDNGKGGLDVPVIKLCADKYVAAPGEVITFTTSNSINASKFSGYEWLGGAVGDQNDIRVATYTSTEPGFHQICIVGNIGQSNNTSTACVDVLITGSGGSVDNNPTTGYVDQFTYIVNDGYGNSNIGIIKITIGWENSKPVVDDLSISTNEETSVSGTLSGSDADNHTLTYSITGNGTLGTATINNASTGAFSYVPQTNQFGTDTFTFVANDGLQNSATGTVTVTIVNTNDMPIAFYTGTINTTEDASAFASTLGGMDADNDPLEFRLVTSANKGTVVITNDSTGTFTYTPNENENGEDTFFFAVHDGTVQSNVAQVSINIAPINDLPIATDIGPLTVHTDEQLSETLSASDVDNDPLSYKIVSQPSKGTLLLDASTGEFTYTPNGSLGADSFTYTASDAYATSNTATVSINVLVANQKPSAQAKTINVFEGVEYTQTLSGSDPESQPLTFSITSNGKLGVAQISNASTGAFSYQSNPGSTGTDFFTFTVNDGDKTSSAATVLVNILSTTTACQGPGSLKEDSDNDGYSDVIETAFGTQTNNASSTPAGLLDADYGIDFSNDSDSDGYSDISELWLGSNYADITSNPSESLKVHLPNCFSALYDGVPPVLKALSVLTPTVDLSSGPTNAQFALTAMDNASGVKTVALILTSPSGVELSGSVTTSDDPLIFHGQLVTDNFSQWAEAGTWTITEIKLRDAAGYERKYNTSDLTTLGYPSTLTVVNPNSDVASPTVDNFEVLTPTLDVISAAAHASFRVTVSDNVSGIARVAVTLTSPSGATVKLGEELRSDNQTSLISNIDTNNIDTFDESGIWNVTELLLIDQAGNRRSVNNSSLVGSGFDTQVVVTNSVPDTTPPQLVTMNSAFATIDVSQNNARGEFSITATDDISGVAEITLTLQGPTGGFATAYYSSLQASTSFEGTLLTNIFPASAIPGPCVYYALTLVDAVGNSITYDQAQLATLGYTFAFNVTRPSGGGGQVNYPPTAYTSSFQTNEDTVLSANLNATDPEGDSLTYSIVAQPTLGTVSFTNKSSGAFTYTPNPNVAGNDYFIFKVDDGLNESNTAIVTIAISSVDDATIALDLEITVTEDTLYFGGLSASDPDGEIVSYEILSQPAHGTLTLQNATTGSYIYEPNTNYSGSDSFTYRASDANTTSGAATVSITVLPEFSLMGFDVLTETVNGLNTLVPISAAITLSKDISQVTDVKVNLVGPSNQEITLQGQVQGNAYPFVLTNNIYTPTQPLEAGTWTFKNLLAKKSGASLFELVVSDIAGAGFESTLTVLANTTPTASNGSMITSLGTTKTGTMSASDPEGDTLTYRIVSQPAKGTITVTNANTGEFSFTATALGEDTFKFVANDGTADSAQATFTITINAVNGVPVANASTITATKNLVYIGALSAVDPDADTLTYSIVTQPVKGILTLTDSQTGAYEYRPNSDVEVPDSDSFTFKVNDGNSDSNTATVSINIQSKPVTSSANIVVFSNIAYNGQLSAVDPDDDDLTYHIVSNPTLGTVTVTAVTGAFVYTPNNNEIGPDVFTFRVYDGQHYSNTAIMSVNIISAEQACGLGGVVSHLDTDNDGYVDIVETAFSTAIDDASDTPANLSASDLGILFTDDDDSDTYADYVEVWLDANPNDATSMPQNVLNACFDSLSDGIKPRLIGFNITTPSIDIGNNETTVGYALSLMDNASGIKRVRISLISPSSQLVTTSISFETHPVITHASISSALLNEYSESGIWTISSVTLYDEAGNRLDISTDDLSDNGYATQITVTNSNGDTTAPTLNAFSVTRADVYPGTEVDQMQLTIEVSDDISGVSSARIDMIGPSGVIVTATQTLASPLISTTILLETAVLSRYLEAGVWTVHSLLLVDAAGNSVDVASQVNSDNSNVVTITNPLSDAIAPTFEAFSILTPIVYPSSGDARMRFSVSASDNAAGIEKIRIDLQGPSGQVITAWGYYENSYPLDATAQVTTQTLSTLTEEGTWLVTGIAIFDDAGNSTSVNQAALINSGFSSSLLVQY